LDEKLRAFGWEVASVDGHSFPSLENLAGRYEHKDKPLCVVADTTKGKGMGDLAGTVDCHYLPMDAALFEKALMFVSEERERLLKEIP
jgi:transketolase